MSSASLRERVADASATMPNAVTLIAYAEVGIATRPRALDTASRRHDEQC